jgi:hypothetical protein
MPNLAAAANRAWTWTRNAVRGYPDRIALALAVSLIAAAFIDGAVLLTRDVPLDVWKAPPVFAKWLPHVGATTPAAVAIAVLVVGYGPLVAGRLGWRRLLLASYGVSLLWVFALGLVDGWSRLAGLFDRKREYLAEVHSAPPLLQLLPTYTDGILKTPSSWVTQVAGHPPGALEFFVLLDWLGLTGGGWAAAVCMIAGSSACVAVAITVRNVAGERLARHAVPYLVLAPAALWIGVSADAFFLAVAAWGIALLAVATRRAGLRGDLFAAGSGLLLGYMLYLSYGLVLMAAVAAAVLVARRRVRPGLVCLAGVAAVVAAATAAGFWWWDGYQQVRIRYQQGWGGDRPYSYWVWADLAVLVLCTGPAMVPGVRRLVMQGIAALRRRGTPQPVGLAVIVLGAAVAVTVATISGMSKAEVGRIWLPFAIWLVAACAVLPRPRRWLAGQAITALLMQHFLLLHW